jgi:hypothetical protein
MEEMDLALLRGKRILTRVAPAPGGLEDPLFLASTEDAGVWPQCHQKGRWFICQGSCANRG